MYPDYRIAPCFTAVGIFQAVRYDKDNSDFPIGLRYPRPVCAYHLIQVNVTNLQDSKTLLVSSCVKAGGVVPSIVTLVRLVQSKNAPAPIIVTRTVSLCFPDCCINQTQSPLSWSRHPESLPALPVIYSLKGLWNLYYAVHAKKS